MYYRFMRRMIPSSRERSEGVDGAVAAENDTDGGVSGDLLLRGASLNSAMPFIKKSSAKISDVLFSISVSKNRKNILFAV